MHSSFKFNAQVRAGNGTSNSRGSRRTGLVPAIIYGDKKDPVQLLLKGNELARELKNKAIFSHIIEVNIEGKTEKAIIKSLQRHPFKPEILHVDLQRVNAHTKITVHVALNFIGKDHAQGIKDGGIFSQHLNNLEVSCLPKDLPEFIDLEVSHLGLNESIHLSQVKLPAGVELASFDEDNDEVVVAIHLPKQESDESTEVVAAGAVPTAREEAKKKEDSAE